MELPVQQFRTKAEQAYLDMFVAAEKALPGARNNWVSGLRTKAIEAYGRLGLPHRRIEAWKYTDLRARLTDVNPLLKAEGVAVSEAELARALGSELASLPAYRLVVVEGDLQGRSIGHRGPEGRRRRGGLARPGAREASGLAQGRSCSGQSARGRSGASRSTPR